MGSLDVYYEREHAEQPVVVSTAAEVAALVERVRASSPPAAPLLLDVHMSGDPYAQGLDVGIAADRGVIRYAGRDWPAGVFSTGDGRWGDKAPFYYYMDHDSEFPACSEIPLDTVEQAIVEFMESGGARPECVDWQEDGNIAQP